MKNLDVSKLTGGIIDISHYQRSVDWREFKQGGGLGAIIKATQGLGRDPWYNLHSTGAKAVGVMHGAYHFGTGAVDGYQQADFFLSVVKPTDKTLVMLDFEDNPKGTDMACVTAVQFVQRIESATGRKPLFYSNWPWCDPRGAGSFEALTNCPLNVAGYVKPQTLRLPHGWDRFTFWQYTNGVNGIAPHGTPGVGYCDRNFFNGTPAELKTFWEG